ncbi:hypothetical protein ACK8OR_01790 [Jannaschia sp. KMU-145]|uniref:hypothetical protein n=1 Tax=Jannaschia halovivens TaxID=3388667 RepID=UPI00396B2394
MSFENLICEDEKLQARYDIACNTVIEIAKNAGVSLSKSDVSVMPSVRLAVLDGTEIGGEHFERELRNLPAMIAAKEKADHVDALQRGERDAHDRLARMSPADRMTFARENDIRAIPQEESADDEAARLQMVLNLSNPAARIAAARRLGIVK